MFATERTVARSSLLRCLLMKSVSIGLRTRLLTATMKTDMSMSGIDCVNAAMMNPSAGSTAVNVRTFPIPMRSRRLTFSKSIAETRLKPVEMNP